MPGKRQVKAILQQRFAGQEPDWSIPLNYNSLEVLKAQTQEKLKYQAEVQLKERLEEKKEDVKKAQHKAFHQQNTPMPIEEKPQDPKPQADEPNYAAEEISPAQEKEFEAELEAFMDVVENEPDLTPRPEKW